MPALCRLRTAGAGMAFLIEAPVAVSIGQDEITQPFRFVPVVGHQKKGDAPLLVNAQQFSLTLASRIRVQG